MTSVQLATYLQARADGATVAFACLASGIGKGEAELHEADIASGELVLPIPSLERGEGGRGKAVPALTQQAAATPGKCGSMAPGNVAKQHSNPPGPDALEGHAPEPLPRARARAREDEPSGETNMANGNIAADELRLLIERIERLKEEIKGLNDDVSDVFKEAKSRGFDTWAMKEVLKWRRLETHTRDERATLLELYMDAAGIKSFDAAILKAA